MKNATLKKEAKKAIDKLSEEKVRVAIDFIDYLKEKEEMEATLEILTTFRTSFTKIMVTTSFTK